MYRSAARPAVVVLSALFLEDFLKIPQPLLGEEVLGRGLLLNNQQRHRAGHCTSVPGVTHRRSYRR